jgi:hypothetical protein
MFGQEMMTGGGALSEAGLEGGQVFERPARCLSGLT